MFVGVVGVLTGTKTVGWTLIIFGTASMTAAAVVLVCTGRRFVRPAAIQALFPLLCLIFSLAVAGHVVVITSRSMIDRVRAVELHEYASGRRCRSLSLLGRLHLVPHLPPLPVGSAIRPDRRGPRPPRSRLEVIIGILATVVILVVGGALLVGNLLPLPRIRCRRRRSAAETMPRLRNQDSPGRASPSGPSPQPLSICQRGNPNHRSPHPDDGRVYGGNLSFADQDTFDPANSEPRFSFAWDVTQQIKIVSQTPGWIAQLAVGQLRADDFGGSARTTAEQVAECVVTGDLYRTPAPPEPMFGVRRSRSTAVPAG